MCGTCCQSALNLSCTMVSGCKTMVSHHLLSTLPLKLKITSGSCRKKLVCMSEHSLDKPWDVHDVKKRQSIDRTPPCLRLRIGFVCFRLVPFVTLLQNKPAILGSACMEMQKPQESSYALRKSPRFPIKRFTPASFTDRVSYFERTYMCGSAELETELTESVSAIYRLALWLSLQPQNTWFLCLSLESKPYVATTNGTCFFPSVFCARKCHFLSTAGWDRI